MRNIEFPGLSRSSHTRANVVLLTIITSLVSQSALEAYIGLGVFA